jgi:hypothetical protein
LVAAMLPAREKKINRPQRIIPAWVLSIEGLMDGMMPLIKLKFSLPFCALI